MVNIKRYKIIDFYLGKPLICDVIIIILLWIVSYQLPPFLINLIKIPEKQIELNYISSLISISVTLAGFIIAALTILITVKSSLKARGYEDAENALEYIFSTKHYKSIIQVFINSIIEF